MTDRSKNAIKKHWLPGVAFLLLSQVISAPFSSVEAETVAIENSRQAIDYAISSRTPIWRLSALELPSQQPVDVDFSEVQVFSPDSAWVTEKNGKFIRHPREPIRVFRGDPADSADSDAVVILVYRANGDLQGRWHASQNDYELVMHAED